MKDQTYIITFRNGKTATKVAKNLLAAVRSLRRKLSDVELVETKRVVEPAKILA